MRLKINVGFLAFVAIAIVIILLATDTKAATTPNVTIGDPENMYEGMRFLGDRDDFDVMVVNTGAQDTEPMLVAIRKGTTDPAAFFRAGAAQCYDKIGGPIPCNQVQEHERLSAVTPMTPYSGIPGALVPELCCSVTPPTTIPPYVVWPPVPPEYPVVVPPIIVPPVDPVDPVNPTPIPLPASAWFLVLGLAWLLRLRRPHLA